MVNIFLPLLLITLFIYATIKKQKPYDNFILGAKESIPLAVSVFPYLVAIFILTELFEISGLSDAVTSFLAPAFKFLGIPPELAKLVIIKPFSGSGSLGILSDVYLRYGVDSYIARCASCIYGSSETTFYIASVYFAKTKSKSLFLPISISLIATFISTIFACFICLVL